MAKERKESAPESTTDDAPPDEALRCVVCDHRISERAFRSEMNGAHEHTFVNPHGIVHHIGCFVAAPGAAHVGATESAFSWFPGWAWQVAVCGRCRAHVGWIFVSCVGRHASGGHQFHGLILAALK